MGIQNLNSAANNNINNMKAFIAFSALLAVAFAAGPPAPYHPAPVYGHPAPAYGKGPVYEDTPAVYGYEYGVQDEYSGANFGQNEKRDGYATSGSYRVLLPDGRTQTVTYHTADAYSGNIAEVTYEGHATYGPAPKAIHKPGPIYKPAPIHG